MSFPFRRASVRLALAVGLVAAALPLVAANAAQAALAGANPLTTTLRPDLRSATLTGATTAQFCFDKAIISVPDIGGFAIGGYRADSFEKSTTATASGNCVDATFPAADFTSYTYGQVGEGAVRAAGNNPNRADSVALAGTTTQNGTRGLTTAPDLQGISVVTVAPQELAFTFDQAVNPTAVFGNGGFHFVTSNGPNCPPTTPACDVASQSAQLSSSDPKTVIVSFPVGGTPLVTNAVRGYIVPGAVRSATAEGTLGTWDSAPNPGSAGVVTGVPTLLGAVNNNIGPVAAGALFAASAACPTAPTSANQCTVVDYTFNEGVSVNNAANTLANFYAYLSDGSFDHPVALTEPTGVAGPVAGTFHGSATVRAYYAVASHYDEYLVKAGVSGAGTTTKLGTVATAPAPFAGGCTAAQQTPVSLTDTCGVVSSTTGHPNTPGSAPIGGNTGAHSTGFTTAPDAFGTAFDTLTNTVSVTFDSRVYLEPGQALATAANKFQLLDGNGNTIAGATTIATCSPSTVGFPGVCPLPNGTTGTAQHGGTNTVWLTYPSPAVQVGNGKSLEIQGWVGGSNVFGFAVEGGDRFGGALPLPTPAQNVLLQFAADNLQQIVSPTTVAAHTHLRARSNRWSHKRVTKAYLQHVLAKTRHHNKKHSK